MMFSERNDLSLSISESNKLDSIIKKYNDERGPTVIEAYQDGLIDSDQLLDLSRILEINGYYKWQLYDLPYAFALRIME